MRAAARADRSYNKAVEQIDVVTGEIVATFPSQSDAEVRPNEQTERAKERERERAKEREREREREREKGKGGGGGIGGSSVHPVMRTRFYRWTLLLVRILLQ